MNGTETPLIIGERSLELAGRRAEGVTVRLGLPATNRAFPGYRCQFWISGSGFNVADYASGVDGIQAIQLAFVVIGGHLSRIEAALGSQLLWNGHDDTGFPRP